MTNKLNLQFGLILLLILAAATCRILPHLPNFTPIAAMGLFCAAYLKSKWQAFLIPFAAMFCSDLYLNNVVYKALYVESGITDFQWITSGWIYAAFTLVIFAGQTFLKKISVKNVVIASLTSSLIFFVVTNFSVWYGSGMYPKDAAGLVTCFAAGIPFFGNSIAGDLFFNTVLFGAFETLKVRLPKLA